MVDLIYKKEYFKIKNACIEVRKNLGNGFLEKVYENALAFEFRSMDFSVETQKSLNVIYKDQDVGQYFADIVIDNKIIIELKCVNKLMEIHKAQLLNYLKTTNYQLGVLINFPNNRSGFEIIRIPNFISGE